MKPSELIANTQRESREAQRKIRIARILQDDKSDYLQQLDSFSGCNAKAKQRDSAVREKQID